MKDKFNDFKKIINNEPENKIVDNIVLGEIKPDENNILFLYASNNIKKDTILCELNGQIVFFEEKYLDYEWNYIGNNILLIRPFRTKYSFISHSKASNCIVKHFFDNFGTYQKSLLITSKDIKYGEKILLDYEKENLPEEYFILKTEKK